MEDNHNEAIDEEEQYEWEDHGASNEPIILEVTANISRREPTPQNPHLISLWIDSDQYPHVSSKALGGVSSHDTVEEAKASLQRWIQHTKEWLQDYRRPIEVKLKVVNQLEKQQDLVQFF